LATPYSSIADIEVTIYSGNTSGQSKTAPELNDENMHEGSGSLFVYVHNLTTALKSTSEFSPGHFMLACGEDFLRRH